MFDDSYRKTASVDLTSYDVYHRLLFLSGIFACAPVVTVFGFSFYKLLLILVVLYLVFSGRLLIGRSGLQGFAAISLITFLITIVRVPSAYVSVQTQGLISIILIAMIAGVLRSDREASHMLIRGFLWGGKLNIIWIYIQIISWWYFSVDINNLLFSQILGMVKIASQFKATGFVATGLCWNVGGIVASLFLVFLLEVKPYWKILTITAGVLTQSSTAILGITLCLIFIFLRRTFSNTGFLRKCFSIKWIFCIICFLSFFVFGYINSPTVQRAIHNALSFTVFRIGALNGNNLFDSSAQAHTDYITNIPALLDNTDLLSLLFGYGINCSGLPYTVLTGQYASLSAWTIECDLTNSLLGLGFVGTVAFYLWLFAGMFRTWRFNKNAAFLLLIFSVCGLFYNLQSVNSFWLMLCEAAVVSYFGCGPESINAETQADVNVSLLCDLPKKCFKREFVHRYWLSTGVNNE